MSTLTQIKSFIQKNRFESLLIFSIFLLALTLRLYKIDGYMTFLGDEGRDVRVVRNILKGDPAFIGPQTSIGNMYLGPLYYYMMAPALFISNLDPVGPAVMIALLGSFTVVLTWLIGREWFGKVTGLIAAFLFAISPVAIIYSRSSWNPNPMPFFALIVVYSLYKVRTTLNWRWFYLTSLAFASALQMHYLGLLLAPFIGLFSLLSLYRANSEMRKHAIKPILISIGIFLALMSPLFVFDLKHNYMNTNAFKAFFTDRQTTVNANPLRSDRFIPVFEKLTSDLLLGMDKDQASLVAVFFVILSVFPYFSLKQKTPYYFLVSWILLGWLGLGVYKQHIYAHYFGFLYPAFYLMTGLIVASLYHKGILGKLVGVGILSFLVYQNVTTSPLMQNPNYQKARTERAVTEVIKESQDKPFNFALIAKQNYDESYRYYFENKNAKLVRGEDGITDQLFVICEDGDKCQPEGNPGWQVAIFGPASTEKFWQVDHLRLYKLVHKSIDQ